MTESETITAIVIHDLQHIPVHGSLHTVINDLQHIAIHSSQHIDMAHNAQLYIAHNT